MAEYILSAFADEAGSTPEEQISALLDNGIPCIEPRNFYGKGILTLTNDELYEIKKALDKAIDSIRKRFGKEAILPALICKTDINFSRSGISLPMAKGRIDGS